MGGGRLSLIEFLGNLAKDKPPSRISSEMLSIFNSECTSDQSSDNKNVPRTLRRRLQKVADFVAISGEGIPAVEFFSCFEDVTQCPLILHELGYRNLSDLIDDVPDIFIWKPSMDRRSYDIYPASDFKSKIDDSIQNLDAMEDFAVSFLIDRVVLNIRKLLEAYSEGIKIQDIPYIYSMNYKEFLNAKELGFDDLETFLSSIIDRVPFRFDLINDEKSIHSTKRSDSPSDLSSCSTIPEACNDNEAFPVDAAIPEFEYKAQTFPSDFDFSKFIPAYTSAVAHPGRLYIQLAEADDFKNIVREIDDFYDENQSEQYVMKNIHIKVGASCIAKSLNDCHWYRVQILSIPSTESVLVQYVDVGTRHTILKSLLRYAKKEFVDLPAQALKCRLAFLKPPKNATKWDLQSTSRILNLCEDVHLMAKIDKIEDDGIYSIILCDTNGDEDVYIHEVLCKEGLAEFDVADRNQSNPVMPESKVHLEHCHCSNPLQALQAQYFLQAFAVLSPSFAQDDNYLNLLQQVSIYNKNFDPACQNISLSCVPPAGPGYFNSSLITLANAHSLLCHAFPSAASGLRLCPVSQAMNNISFSNQHCRHGQGI